MDLTVAAFDEPARFRPTLHFGAETMHRAWLNTEGLPEHLITDNPRPVERWTKAIGKGAGMKPQTHFFEPRRTAPCLA
jgi:hypothetical protein